MKVFETLSEKETFDLGCRIGAAAGLGQCYALSGDLGVGKTVFAKGFAKGLGIEGDIVSPTFTILHEYYSPLHFCHFDIYRLGSEDELYDIGWEEYTAGSSVCLVEWAELLRDAMPADTVWIQIEKDLSRGTDYRRITVSGSEGTEL